MTSASEPAKPAIAFWLESDNQKACELARLAGFDIVLFDMEHGILDLRALDRLLPFCQAIGLAPMSGLPMRRVRTSSMRWTSARTRSCCRNCAISRTPEK